MAKSDHSINELELDKAFGPTHTPQFAEEMQINGFDTETADGDIFMVSYAFEGFGGEVKEDKGEILDPTDVWELLTCSQARSALNMWYNLSFDANVVLGSFLTEENAAKLAVNNTVQTEDYEIIYIPTKFLKIVDSNNHCYTHYDASQFFYATLDNAVEEWLGQNKTEDVNPKRFGKKDGRVNEYIEDNYGKIRKYARKDATLVQELWAKAVSVGEDLDIPMGKPFSTGYLAESYLNNTLNFKPGLGPHDMVKMAWDSYAGGRFEVFKRGNVGEVVGPDINSAYPHILANLPDPDTLVWQNRQDPSIEKIRNCDYGFIDCTVTTNKDKIIQPFTYKSDKSNSVVKFPAMQEVNVSCIKDIFIHALDNDIIESFEIHDSWLGQSDGSRYPFSFIDTKYNQRKNFESQGQIKKAKLLKIILNSMYGKTAQTTLKRERVNPNQNRHLKDSEYYVSELSIPKQLRNTYENGFIEWLECGNWFNPFLASYITGLTRLELFKKIVEYGLEDNLVMFATDSVMIEKEAFDNTDFRQNEVEKGLGNWDLDYQGEAFVIGAGVYEVMNREGLYTKTRGFQEADLEKGLEYQAMQNNDTIEIVNNRPSTVFEAIWSNEPINEVGKFEKYDRKIFPDMDNKRNWDNDDPDFESLLARSETSIPLVVSGSD